MLDSIARRVSNSSYRFRGIRKVVFLCGGNCSANRNAIAEYLRKKHEALLVFYADNVWEEISSIPGRNALEMEEMLAALSDVVVLLVESPGTFTELGAFSLSDALRAKLLPIVERSHKNEPSFINTGPIRWIDKDSAFAPTIWVDSRSVLTCVRDLDERLQRLKPEKSARVSNLVDSPKHLLFFVCDLVAIAGPCPRKVIEYLATRILQPTSKIDVASLVGLAHALSILQRTSVGDETYYFMPLNGDQKLQSFHRNRFINVPALRAEVLSVAALFPQGRSAIKAMTA